MTTLSIATTWDGDAVDSSEAASVSLVRTAEGLQVTVRAPWHGDPSPPGLGSTWGLWEYEVVELFVLGPDDQYTEVELGPHGHFLVLRLHGERQVVARELPLAYAARREGAGWLGEALIPWTLLPAEPWRGNAYAIHGQGSGRRYLVAHPLGTEQPDFHAIGAFPDLRVG